MACVAVPGSNDDIVMQQHCRPLRLRLSIIAVAVLAAGAPAIAAGPTPPDGGVTVKADSAAPPENGGKLEIVPGPQGPPKPPDLGIPPVALPPRDRLDTEGNPALNEKFEQHQESPPPAWKADEPPRGEGAAAIPRQTPSGIKAIEDWLWSWFE